MLAAIGCSGWFYPHWKKTFYPEEIPQSRWFKYYASKLSTVGLNSTFYHFPKVSTAKRWYGAAPEGFIYMLKVNRMITHIKRFSSAKRLIDDFYAVGDALKEKMGCFLFQLPPSMKFSREKLAEMIGQLDLERKNVLEFRHASWFMPEVYEVLRKNGVIFCSVSSPNLPEELVQTASDIYVRFHGKHSLYSSKYSDEELAAWAKQIRKSEANQVWAYFNNDFNANAPKNALTLRAILENA